MNTFAVSNIEDRFTILFRWIILIMIGVVATLTKWFTPVTLGVITILGLWNTIISIISILDTRIQWQSYISIVLDVAAACALFIYSGGLAGSMVWIGILPVVNAGICFGWQGVLWSGAIISLTQIVWVTCGGVYGSDRLVWMGASLAADVLVILGMGWLSSQVLPRWYELLAAPMQDKTPKTADEDARLIGQGSPQPQYVQVLDELNSTMEYPDILNAVLDAAIVAMGEPRGKAEQMVGLILCRDTQGFSVICSRLLAVNDQRVVLGGEFGVLALVQMGSRMAMPFKPSEDPELERIISVRVCKSGAAMPLINDRGLYGILVLAHPDRNYFTPERLSILELLGYNAAMAIQNALKVQESVSMGVATGKGASGLPVDLLTSLQTGPMHFIYQLAQHIKRIQFSFSGSPDNLESEITRMGELARQADLEMSRWCLKTNPINVCNQRLETALQGLQQRLQETRQQQFNIRLDDSAVARLDPNLKQIVYQISEEIAWHACVYSDADTIFLRLRAIPQDSDILLLEITDNGPAGEKNNIKTTLELQNPAGLQAVETYVHAMDGLLYMDASLERGNRLRVFIPLSQRAVDRLAQL